MKTISGGVTAPLGFLAAGVYAGIKKKNQLDLALLLSERAGPVAGVFTTNRIVAAPVILDRLHLKKGVGRAILVNSGNANACTGPEGSANRSRSPVSRTPCLTSWPESLAGVAARRRGPS